MGTVNPSSITYYLGDLHSDNVWCVGPAMLIESHIAQGCMIPELVITIKIVSGSADVTDKNVLFDLLLMVPVITINAVATLIIAYKTW